MTGDGHLSPLPPTARLPKSARVFHGVIFGEDVLVGDSVIIGQPPRGKRAGELETRIGARAVIRSPAKKIKSATMSRSARLSIIEHYVTVGNHVTIGAHASPPARG